MARKGAEQMLKESKNTEEIVSIGFGMVSSALGARKHDNEEARMEQYYADLALLLKDLNMVDTSMLNIYLADFSAGLIVVLAEHLEITEEQCIQNMALALEDMKRREREK